MRNEEKIFEYCIKEMFNRVGEKYPNETLTSDPNWYTLRSWTEKEQDDFVAWMNRTLKRKFRVRKRDAELTTSFFLLNWGWTTIRKLPLAKVIKR